MTFLHMLCVPELDKVSVQTRSKPLEEITNSFDPSSLKEARVLSIHHLDIEGA